MKEITDRFDAIIRIGTEAVEGSCGSEPGDLRYGYTEADLVEAAYLMVKVARFEMTPESAVTSWNDWLSK